MADESVLHAMDEISGLTLDAAADDCRVVPAGTAKAAGVLCSLLSGRSAMVATPVVAPTLVAQTRSNDPLALFQKMMPVLTHERCVNCHGGFDPFGPSHSDGPVDRALVQFDPRATCGKTRKCVSSATP